MDDMEVILMMSGSVTNVTVPIGHFMMISMMLVNSVDFVVDDDDDGDNIGESKRGTCHRYEGL